MDAVVDKLVADLDDYVFPDAAKKVQAELQTHRGDYRTIVSPTGLADRLTADMRTVGHDKHLAVSFGEEMGVRKTPTPEEQQQAHSYDTAMGRGLRSARRLPGNVGYLDLAYFSPDPDAGGELAAAMQLLSGCDALIIDLRRNGGGSGESASTLLSYFFGDEVQLPSAIEKDDGRTVERQHWTSPYVAGPRFLTRTVYVLVGPHTHSAAELFAYVLKTTHRGVIVGEPTSGDATSSTGELDLGYGFTAFIANGQIISPITHTNWLNAGVQPDIATLSGQELTTAYKKALDGVAGATMSAGLAKERAKASADPAAALAEELTDFPSGDAAPQAAAR